MQTTTTERRCAPPPQPCTTKDQRLACDCMQPTGWTDGRIERRACDICKQGLTAPRAAS